MPAPPPDSHPAEGANRGVGRTAAPAAPRWVKVLGAIALLLVVVLAVALLTGGSGRHGPGRHSGDDAPAGQAAPSSAAGGHARAAGASHGARQRRP